MGCGSAAGKPNLGLRITASRPSTEAYGSKEKEAGDWKKGTGRRRLEEGLRVTSSGHGDLFQSFETGEGSPFLTAFLDLVTRG